MWRGKIYSLSLKSLSCRVSLSTMDCLFDFNKACMNEKSHHLTNVSAMQGDKQGGAEGRRERQRRDEGRKRRRGGPGRGREGFFELWEAFQFYRAVPSSQWAEEKTTITLFLCVFLSLPFSVFSNNFKQHFHINGCLFCLAFLLPKLQLIY